MVVCAMNVSGSVGKGNIQPHLHSTSGIHVKNPFHETTFLNHSIIPINTYLITDVERYGKNNTEQPKKSGGNT